MTRSSRMLRAALAALAAFALVALLLLAGCGKSDPYTGTWRTSGRTLFVIAKTDKGYRIAWTGGNIHPWLSLAQQGGHLKFTYQRPSGKGAGLTTDSITLVPKNGHLVMRDTSSGHVIGPITMNKASDSTALPSPAPSS
jgi:hypothetical protein